MVQIFAEGEVFNKYMKNRMIKRNQNVILAITGSTGSGKSYGSLRVAELWYLQQFKRPFPMRNVCFSIDDVMRLLNANGEDKLEKGELIIIEEGGVLLNSLDFQNKISKLFSYVLQSFRSMNIGLIINLPVLSMLNKSARLLLHAHFITSGIDYQNKTCKFKPMFHQLNQQKGKSYYKFMRARKGRFNHKISMMFYSLPSKELIDSYELKKLKFVSNLNENFLKEIEERDRKEKLKMARDDLTDIQMEVYKMAREGLTTKEIAKKRNVSTRTIQIQLKSIRGKGYDTKIDPKFQENESRAVRN